MAGNLTRREALKLGSLALGAAAVGQGLLPCGSARAQPASGGPAARTRSLRIAHLTDVHVQPERGACDGLEQCLRHVMALDEAPSVIVTGGDMIMDGFEADRARTALQWDLWRRHFADLCALPVQHTLGNHDIWGWNKSRSGARGDEHEWGKRWAMDELGLDTAHQSRDHGAWRIVTLDNVQRDAPDGYVAFLDEAQFEWLDRTLADAAGKSMHVLVVSHIPIFSAAALDWSRPDATGKSLRVSGGLMHLDANKVMGLFRSHGCVRACLSGHLHRIERIDYDGVAFICDGAVCGSWWKGPENQCDEGYGVVDLFSDGSFDWRYQRYGWTARA